MNPPAVLNRPFVIAIAFFTVAGTFAQPLAAQIAMHPSRVSPASMERFALRVASGSETTERVSILLPGAINVLGVEESGDWSFQMTVATAEDPARIVWSGGVLEPGAYREFAFFGRLAADADRRDLIFPVTLTRAGGDQIEYSYTGGVGPPPTVTIVGSTAVTPWGAVGIAGLAVTIAIVALGLSVSRARSSGVTGSQD